MSKKQRMEDDAYRERIELVANLALYWFNREYHGALGLDPETLQPTMTDEETLAIQEEKAEKLWNLTDEELQRFLDSTVVDIMSQSPLRNMFPKEQRVQWPAKLTRYT